MAVNWSIDLNKLPLGRKEAKVLGSKYYIGSPCKRGHIGVRRTNTANCIHCQSYHNRKNHKDKKEPTNIKSLNLAETLMEEKDLSENISEVWDE